MFFPCIQSWTCGETELEISPAWFTESGFSCFIIQNVVDELEDSKVWE
jgi:hypothetical protein